MKVMNSRLKITILSNKCLHVLFALMLAFIMPVRTVAQDYYPVHATVQVLPPYSLYLSDYSNGFRDRLVITLYNRDLQQQTLDCRLRLRISNTSGFCIESRDEVPQRSITVEPNVPLRLTSQDIAPYLQTGNVKQTGTLRNGRLPEGMMTFSVQVVEQHTGRILSPWASGRAWLETKKPPMLVMPEKDETVAFADPQHILFRWYPQHLGLSGVEYELHIRKMPDYCQNPAAQYDSGTEVFTTKTRQTLYNYSNIDPELIPGYTYAWRVRAVAMDGIDEVGVFDNDGYSETGWFRVVRGCDAPVIDRAEAGYRKLDLGWHGSVDDMRYTVQYSAEKENGSYNWTDTTTIDNETTLYGLTPGATYSYRVGALCSATGKPVYSQIGTVQIPNRDSISAANCGVAPVYKELSKERKTDLKVGDRVTVGGDYTMLITELNSKGNGVYGGKGRLTFTWVFFVGLEVTFDDLVVNTDGYQIDGTVNTVYDGTNTNIANLDQLSDGGVNNRESHMSADGRSTLMNFSVPPMPRSDLSEDGGSVVVYDLSGAPHTIEIPSNGNGGQSIPFSLTDIDGNTWRFESCDSVVTDSLTGSQKTVHGIKMTKLDAVSGFSKDKLSDKVKARIAFMNGGQYAFDNLSGRYYSRSSKLGKDYLDKSGLGDGTYAPWKLVPMGKSDKIKAGLNPTKIDIDIASVRFVDADGHDLESSYDSDNAVWTVSLTAAATEGNYYNVYAVAKPKDGKGSYQTIGKLFVVSYKTTKADIVLLPVEKHDGDISKLNAEISGIFAPCGVEISITESDALVGNTGWDLNGDGKLSLTNDAETDNVKRSAEMKALEDIVKSMPDYDKNALYLVYVPNGSKSADVDVEGNWGRGRQIGYVFEKLEVRTVAHEVGHAFTLQHTFDRQYGGNETRGKTENLMDYTKGIQLDAFQWEILAHNAPKIVASVADGTEDNWIVKNVAAVDTKGYGLSPDGKVIVSAISKDKVVRLIKPKSCYVNGFGIYSSKKKLLNSYNWNGETYITKDGKDIADAEDIEITYYDCSKKDSKAVVDSVWIFDCQEGNQCFYKQGLVSYNAKNKAIITAVKDIVWRPRLLFSASDSCRAEAERYASQYTNCTPEKIAKDKKRIAEITDETKLEKIADVVNLCCHDALCEVPCDTLFYLIKRLAKTDKLSDKYETAILCLMEAINKDCYSDFYSLLESDEKALLKRLVRGIDDVGFWGTGDNYTRFIGILCRMFQNVQSWEKRVSDDNFIYVNLSEEPFDYSGCKELFGEVCAGKHLHKAVFNKVDGTIGINEYIAYYDLFGNALSEVDSEYGISVYVGNWLQGFGWNNLHWKPSASIEHLSPLTPVFVSIKDQLPLVKTALSEAVELDGVYIVPAVALSFIADKESNHRAEVATMVALDAVTLATAAPVAFGSKVALLRRVWAVTEMVGAAGDIAINVTPDMDENLKTAIDVYNTVWGLIGVKNVLTGSYRGIRTIHFEKTVDIKNVIVKQYGIYKAAIKKIKDSGTWKKLPEQIRKKLVKQDRLICSFADFVDSKSIAIPLNKEALDAILKEKCGFAKFSEKFSKAYNETVLKYYNDAKLMMNEEEALSRFYNFLEKHGDHIDKESLKKFLNEMFAKKKGKINYDKFKVAVTTIESLEQIDNLKGIEKITFEKYILEGELRRCDVAVEIFDEIKKTYFIETKNYREVYGIFSNMGQFKAYIKKISSFDEIIYVIQKRDKVQNVEDVIVQMKKALAKDAKAAFEANKNLWETVGVTSPTQLSLEALNANKKFNDAIKNCIKLTD